METHISPYADILAWCLMPNHFHLMILVRKSQSLTSNEIMIKKNRNQTLSSNESLTDNKTSQSLNSNESLSYNKTSQSLNSNESLSYNKTSQSLNSSQTLTSTQRQQTLNESIGVMLRSYTRAINKQQKRSGSLFKEHTKAECLNCPNGITPSFFTTDGATKINIELPEQQYPYICFNYIHQNPVKAKLVKNTIDWEFSSAKDYAEKQKGKLINLEVIKEYIE